MEILLGITALSAALGIGGGIYEMTVIDPAWPQRPDIVHPASGGISRKRFWIVIHVQFELLLIASLIVTWPIQEVWIWLVLAFLSHAAMRVWSALDFIPKALAFELSELGTVSLAESKSWVSRSRLRMPLDLITVAGVAMAFAASIAR